MHYETHGRFFYLTRDIILSKQEFEELEEEEQLSDPELILPDGVTREFVLNDLKAKLDLVPSLNGTFFDAPGLFQFPPYPFPSSVVTPDALDVPATLPEPSLHHSVTSRPSDEEVNFDEYLHDPDETIGTGGRSNHPADSGFEILGSSDDLAIMESEEYNGWADAEAIIEGWHCQNLQHTDGQDFVP